MSPRQENINKSVDRALRLLDLFCEERTALSVSELADLLSATRVTIYPTVNALVARGYLDRDGDGKYVLGMKIVERGGEKLASLDMRRVAQKKLRELARTLQGNAHLATLHGSEVLYLEREEGRPAVTLREIIGRRVSPHCTALGKALLAFLPDEDRRGIAEGLDYVRHTPHTISNPKDYLKELESVRKLGYALEQEEFHLGSACIAAPIRRLDGRVVGAISISMAASDLEAQGLENDVKHVLEASNSISSDLGFQSGGGDEQADPLLH